MSSRLFLFHGTASLSFVRILAHMMFIAWVALEHLDAATTAVGP